MECYYKSGRRIGNNLDHLVMSTGHSSAEQAWQIVATAVGAESVHEGAVDAESAHEGAVDAESAHKGAVGQDAGTQLHH